MPEKQYAVIYIPDYINFGKLKLKILLTVCKITTVS